MNKLTCVTFSQEIGNVIINFEDILDASFPEVPILVFDVENCSDILGGISMMERLFRQFLNAR